MSLWTKVQSLWLGVDTDVEQQRQTQLDGIIAASNQKLLDEGRWNQDQYDKAQADLAASDTNNIQAAIDQAYIDGAKEGLANDAALAGKLSDGINSFLKGAVKDVLGAIPWQVWIIAAVVLFVYLGGLGIVRRQIKNAS